MAASFSGGRRRREPLTMGKQLVLYHLRLRVECTLFVINKAGANLRRIAADLYVSLGNTTS